MSHELPEGWASTKLGALCTKPQYGWTTSASKVGGAIKLLRTTDISGGRLDWITVPWCEEVPADLAKYLLTDGDIVVSRAGSVGVSHVLSGTLPKAVFASYLIRFRPLDSIPSGFVRLFLNSPTYWDAVEQEAAGIALQNINASKLADMDVPLPPLAEQKRIVEKAEALLADVNHARDRLAKVPPILKRFRQSVLAAACSGRLTEEWRAEVGRDGDPSAPWPLSTVADVCSTIVDCPHSTPKWTFGGEICLRTTNLFVTGLDLRAVRYVSSETYKERVSRLTPEAGDVVYSREGGILGIACVIPEGLHACLGQRMMLMRPDPRKLRSEFLAHVLNAPSTLAIVRELTGGTAAPHLNVGDIKQFVVPVPPQDEQDEILARVKQLFRLADDIERRVALGLRLGQGLPSALIAKAFSGELVPTEAELARDEGRDYEPASALLARLANQTETTAKPRRQKRSNGKTASR